MGFTLTDLYTFLIEFALCSLFLIIFSSIHYSINSNRKIRKTLNKKKVVHFFYFFAFGAALASLSFALSQLCAKTLGTNIGLPFIILSLIFAMSFFHGISIQVGSLIPSIVWVIVNYTRPGTGSDNLIARIYVLLIFAFVSLALFLLKQKRTFYFFLADTVIVGVTLLMAGFFTDDKFIYHTFETLMSAVLSLLFLGIMKMINNVFTNIANIAIKSVYADKHYLVPESFELNFNFYLKKYRLNQALIILFEIKSKDGSNPNQQLLDNIYEKFNQDEYKPLFFKNEYNKYGVVLSGKQFYINDLDQCFKGNVYPRRLSNDNLLSLQNILLSIPTKYTNNSKTHKYEIKAYASIYGVHSYDINELLNSNMFMINNEDLNNSNVVKIFHSNMTEHITNDAIDYASLLQNIKLDEITVTLELIQMNESKTIYVLPRIYWLKKMLTSYTDILAQLPPNIGNTLLRHLAIKSIELYALSDYLGKYDLIIYYPWEALNSFFYSCNNSVQKIKLFGVDINNIIFCFDAENVKEWPNIVLKHFDEYDEANIKYIVLNVNNTEILKNHHPLFVTFGNEILSNSDKHLKARQVSKKLNINVLTPID